MSAVSHLLTSLNIISSDQLHIAFLEHQRSNKSVEDILIELGFITETTLNALLASHQGVEQVDLAHTIPDIDLIQKVPADVAREYQIIPLSLQGDKLTVAMADTNDIFAIDRIRFFFPDVTEITPALVAPNEVKEALDIYYGSAFSLDQLFQTYEQGALPSEITAESPSIFLVNAIIDDAVKKKASDIHFQPEDVFVRMRYRIDGTLLPIKIFHKRLWPILCGRFKIMAKLNIAENRRPQNGRFHLRLGTHPVDFRVSIHPTVYGESLVVRILDQARGLLSLDNLGFSPHVKEQLHSLLSKSQGLIIVTGPTGSGKTTTLYALLASLAGSHKNIMTLEDPVEYRLPFLRQTEIHEAAGLTFGEGIRSLLRHDPDVLLIGEIRDEDSAQMALRAAMTGHKVLTTLHTNDAYSTLVRLEDLGISRTHLAGTLSGVIAQRLVRCLCNECTGVGCPSCRHTGYQRRQAIVEAIVFDNELDSLLLKKAARDEFLAKAREKGFQSLWEQGMSLVEAGVTNLDEIQSVVSVEEESNALLSLQGH